MKNLLSKAILLILLCGGGFFGFQKYQETLIEKFNKSYISSVENRLTRADNFEQKIKILEDETVYSERPPQSEKLYSSTKSSLKNQLENLKKERDDFVKHKIDKNAWTKAQKADNIQSYIEYIKTQTDGKHLVEAQKKKLEKEKEKMEKEIQDLRNELDLEKPTPTLTGTASGENSISRKKGYKSLFLKKLICNKQREVEGKKTIIGKYIPTNDEIKITINGDVKVNETIETGNTKNLSNISGLTLTSNSYHTVQIEELDMIGNEMLFDISFTGNEGYTPKVYKKEWEGILGGKYTLVYEIKYITN